MLLGSKTVENLSKLVDSLEDLSTALISLSETQLESAIPKIVTTATILQKLCPRIKDGFIKSLSNKTYTL